MNILRNSKFSKVLASYLSIQLLLMAVQPHRLYALTGGPSQPEFNSFTPIGTSDMVNLSSGDFNYNIPIMDIGGYPLNLAYNSGITMDQEASWVGLGWNLNVGHISRQVRGIPDDFKGDLIRYENDSRPNTTVGTHVNFQAGFFGKKFPARFGLGVQYNNYEGITFKPMLGISYAVNDNVKVGLNISSSTAEGATVSPSLSLSRKGKLDEENQVRKVTGDIGIGFNSRQGLSDMSLSLTGDVLEKKVGSVYESIGSGMKRGSISFNNQSFTPYKRAGLLSTNFTFSGGVGVTFLGPDGRIQITGYGSSQSISPFEKDKYVPAFGYQHTEANEGENGILDFNRENDNDYSKNTTVLPVTNYTYDIYAIHGQGAGGQFRPFRGQVGYVYDHQVRDSGNGASFGLEGDVGNLVHTGFDIEMSPSSSSTGKWEDKNNALPRFIEREGDINPMDYESVYFQTVGELGLDPEPELYNGMLHSNKPVRLALTGRKYDIRALPEFEVKTLNTGTSGTQEGTATYTNASIQNKVKRTERKRRNQSIYSVTQADALSDVLVEERTENYIKSHHTAGIKVLKPDGATYVYGATAYNTKKVEATFDVSGSSDVNCSTGIVKDIGTRGNTLSFSDHFLNRITTPAYAHTYLIKSVLSSDYEDIDNNGPSLNDLGAYTLFNYRTHDNDFKWRVPYNTDEASYNEGLKSKYQDQKGNYVYGEKELKYINTIETKTHVAVFKLQNREDGRGARGETSNVSEPGYQKAIDKIYLLSRPEYEPFRAEIESGVADQASIYDDLEKEAIKVAHFEYDYSLCPGVPNNLSGGGKLTLKQVYFTYRGSHMGRYTPYNFNYEKDINKDGVIDDSERAYNNPLYNLKGYDVWGNYKENNPNAGCEAFDPITAAEFPYTSQDKATADKNAKAWTLSSIDLPSGGQLEIETEADEYQYVQKKRVMQLFNVTGAGDAPNPNSESELHRPHLYDRGDHARFIYIKLSDETGLNLSQADLLEQYIGDQLEEAIQFRMLLNMASRSWQYDYVSGYFELDQSNIARDFNIIELTNATTSSRNGTYATLPLKTLKTENGILGGGTNVNPIAKSGWNFARTYLNRETYNLGGESNNTNFVSIVTDLLTSLDDVFKIFNGPNKELQNLKRARTFNPDKSWVRLLNPTKRKLGGGLRVSKLQMHDNWDAMTSNTGNPIYKQFYGQTYNYNNINGTSSGVATYEPASSRENPFITPVYDKEGNRSRDRLAAPRESNYAETPFGAVFFPSPTVTYGRVEVKNLTRERSTGTNNEDRVTLTKHATGRVVNEFYTCFDYPTITDHTDIDHNINEPSALAGILNISVRNHYTMSQGFVVETNDMNGKMKSQRVYAEGQDVAISGVDYNYSDNANGTLKNKLPTIAENGTITDNKTLGMHYDVVNDFRESKSTSETFGVSTNVTAALAGIFPFVVVIPIPKYAFHENILRTAVTTKVIHKTGILKEKVAYDLGSRVSTDNLAWDAQTGQVLLTKTVNEYDNAYYNFTYPAYWQNKTMGLAIETLGIEGYLQSTDNTDGSFVLRPLNTVTNVSGQAPLIPGDMLYTLYEQASGQDQNREETLWVAEVTGNSVKLMDRAGHIINHECSPFTKIGDVYFKVIRSGNKNVPEASMASITSLLNPIDLNNDGVLESSITSAAFNAGVINASAVLYNEYWKPQDQYGLPRLTPSVLAEFNKAVDNDIATSPTILDENSYGFNPYLYNALSEWRAVESYAYLTGRTSSVATAGEVQHLKSDGAFSEFFPFYTLNNGSWRVNTTNANKWTSASTVTEYSPYGAELENRDALNRHSSAIYGYGYTLPIAVASNNKYQELANTNFEDIDYETPLIERSAVIESENFATDEITYFTRDHFSFNRPTGNTQSNGEITNEEAHTGIKSYKVTGDKVEVTKGLTELEHRFNTFDECLEEDGLPPLDNIWFAKGSKDFITPVDNTYASYNEILSFAVVKEDTGNTSNKLYAVAYAITEVDISSNNPDGLMYTEIEDVRPRGTPSRINHPQRISGIDRPNTFQEINNLVELNMVKQTDIDDEFYGNYVIEVDYHLYHQIIGDALIDLQQEDSNYGEWFATFKMYFLDEQGRFLGEITQEVQGSIEGFGNGYSGATIPFDQDF